MKAREKKWRAYMFEKKALVLTLVTSGKTLKQARDEARLTLFDKEMDIRQGDDPNDQYVALCHPQMLADLQWAAVGEMEAVVSTAADVESRKGIHAPVPHRGQARPQGVAGVPRSKRRANKARRI